jgi:predicted dehydrogenase
MGKAMIRLAIIGVGWAGERQVQAIQELGHSVAATCLVDSDHDFLEAKAEELQIAKIYTDLHAALADDEIDAVSICTPHGLHCSMALDAAAAGKHILCEKPIALTVDEATRMIQAAEANEVKLYIAENLCYTALAKTLKAFVSSGQHIGELLAVNFVGGFQARNFGYPGRRDWLTLPDKGGTGTWMLHGIHSMAQLRYILGEVETVYLREHHARSFERPDIEGTMTGLLSLASGVQVAVLQTCEVSLTGDLPGYTLYGHEGVIRASQAGYTVYDKDGAQSLRQDWPPLAISDYAAEIEAFADYVTIGREGPTTGYSERRSLAVVQAGYESAQSGRPVNLKERFGEL